jgi:hypothetical protein
MIVITKPSLKNLVPLIFPGFLYQWYQAGIKDFQLCTVSAASSNFILNYLELLCRNKLYIYR